MIGSIKGLTIGLIGQGVISYHIKSYYIISYHIKPSPARAWSGAVGAVGTLPLLLAMVV